MSNDNKKTKIGASFIDKNGKRLKSHKIFVLDLFIGFVLYSSKKNLEMFKKTIKNRFHTKTECLDCFVNDFENFVFDHCDSMRWKYTKKDFKYTCRLVKNIKAEILKLVQ